MKSEMEREARAVAFVLGGVLLGAAALWIAVAWFGADTAVFWLCGVCVWVVVSVVGAIIGPSRRVPELEPDEHLDNRTTSARDPSRNWKIDRSLDQSATPITYVRTTDEDES